MMSNRVYNFSPGPSTLPMSVLERIQKEFIDYRGLGYSLIEASHRSKTFENILNACKEKLKRHLKLNDSVSNGKNYEVLFLHGGASTCFYQIPMNFLKDSGKVAHYVESGIWAKKAIKEARLFGEVNILASSSDKNFSYIPYESSASEIKIPEKNKACYVYVCSNNTIFGTQWHDYPVVEAPLIADFSSDILCRDLNHRQFDLIFAGLQKNLGPAGLAVMVIEKKLLASANVNLPSMCSYQLLAENNSLFNTPPMFSIYFLDYMLDWIDDMDGVVAIEKNNRLKAQLLYDAIDEISFYQNPVREKDRSLMNITFNLADEERWLKKFLQQAEDSNFIGLKGHRLVGGLRASIYNAFPLEGVEKLVDFLKKFAKQKG